MGHEVGSREGGGAAKGGQALRWFLCSTGLRRFVEVVSLGPGEMFVEGRPGARCT